MILVFYLCILVLSKYIGGKIIKSQNYFYQNLFTIKLFFSELLGRNCFCNIITNNTNYFTNYRAKTLYIYSAIFVCIMMVSYVIPLCIDPPMGGLWYPSFHHKNFCFQEVIFRISSTMNVFI